MRKTGRYFAIFAHLIQACTVSPQPNTMDVSDAGIAFDAPLSQDGIGLVDRPNPRRMDADAETQHRVQNFSRPLSD